MKKSKLIVFIHGVGGSKDSLLSVQNSLKQNGYKVISFDLINHGERKKEKPKCTFLDVIKDTVKIIKTNVKSSSFTLFGHSMGGGIVQAIYPFFKDKVQQVILEAPLTEAIRLMNLEEKYKKYYLDDVFNLLIQKELKNNIENERKNRKIYSENEKIAYARMVLGSEFRIYNDLFWDLGTNQSYNRINSGLKKIKCKIDVLFGSDDKVIPCYTTIYYLKTFNKHVNKIKIFEGLGHNSHKEDVSGFNEAVLNFLKK